MPAKTLLRQRRNYWTGLLVSALFGLATVAGVISVAGCTVDESGNIVWLFDQKDQAPALEKFQSPVEFRDYLLQQAQATRYRGGFAVGDPTPDAAPPAGTGGAAEDGGFSTTNVQETGVDEADVVKNDAEHLYLIAEQGLHIVRAVPANEMQVVSTLELPGNPQMLYLKGDRLVVLDQTDPWYAVAYDYGSGYGYGSVVVTIVDVSDRTAPVIEATFEMEGSLVTSRLIGSALHVVARVFPQLDYSGPNEPPIQERTLDEIIPDLTVTPNNGPARQRNVVEWDHVFRPADPDGYNLTVVFTLNVDRPDEPVRSAAVVGDASTVYASTKAIYLSDNDYDLSGQWREQTTISKLELRDEGAVLVAVGGVAGRLLNRFSLGEYQGHLRVATTTGHVSRAGQGDALNHVYVLEPEDGELRIVGSIEDVAPGERIYSARFLGERGFLVTFKKVDPLFTLDLSDPTSPRVVGELKVPGYSDYIHPLGPNHLLTIGKDTVDMGDFAWYQGVQLSVFDVTNFAEPGRVDVEVVGERGTESEALRDPHAFNYFESAQMLAVPMRIAEGAGQEPSSTGTITFRGLCLYHVTPQEGIEPRGRIATGSPNGWYYSGWTRGIFMGEHVYAVTSSSVQAVPLDNLSAQPIELALQ